MDAGELLARVKASLDARIVYAEPYETDGVTVIPAARLAGGGGGGTGRLGGGDHGDGAGFGVFARPVGAYVVKEGVVTWVPAFDLDRRLRTIAVVSAAALLVAARIGRRCAGITTRRSSG